MFVVYGTCILYKDRGKLLNVCFVLITLSLIKVKTKDRFTHLFRTSCRSDCLLHSFFVMFCFVLVENVLSLRARASVCVCVLVVVACVLCCQFVYASVGVSVQCMHVC